MINLLSVAWPKITKFFQQFAIKLLVPRLLSYSIFDSMIHTILYPQYSLTSVLKFERAEVTHWSTNYEGPMNPF